MGVLTAQGGRGISGDEVVQCHKEGSKAKKENQL